MYVQVVIDTFLCAVISVMVYTYWRFQSHDRLWTRVLVVASTTMLYGVTIYLLWFLQYFLVHHFGEHVAFFETTHFAWFPILDSITAMLAQGYVAHRAWRLNGRSWLLMIVVFVPVTLWLAPVMVANILLTASVLHGLVRKWDFWTPSESYVGRGTRLVLESQLPVTAVSIAFLVEIRVGHGSLVGSAFYGVQSNIYLVGLMYSLNGRVRYGADEDPNQAEATRAQETDVEPTRSLLTVAPFDVPYDKPSPKTSTRSSTDAMKEGEHEHRSSPLSMLLPPLPHAISELSPPVMALGVSLLGVALTPSLDRRWLPSITEEEARAIVTHSSFASMYAKLVIDMALCGLFTMQLITYAKFVRREKRWVLSIVVIASGLTYAISGFIVFYVHHLFVAGWGQRKPFLETNYYCMYPALDAVASSIVQGFFTYRAWRLLGRDWRIVFFLGALIGGSILDMPSIKAPVVVWLTCVMLADIVITAGIGYGLVRWRTGWAHTDKLVDRMVRINLESQVPATLMAMSFLVIFILKPQSLLNFVWQGIQSKFYLIGLLYTLNSRVSFVRGGVCRPREVGITVVVETETFESGGVRSGHAPAPAENEMIPLERIESKSHGRYGSAATVGPMTEEKAEDTPGAVNENETGETLVEEYVFKQHDWE
ncbi:hypothetical protein CspeluHIS016_0300870 [Cutaneotrichosporon spelunceum]|uniref:DUF6534 domain-containing protein n=1 Tax=Cutaneotrichosporon spelunceum TaxID=1672016 RepID=A0AAD3TTI1_9TREE|nr:hypothetical protein CspeluHIS016_0300870 [Cutaneotrichosporon spelunceum]